MEFELDDESALVRIVGPVAVGCIVFGVALLVTFPDDQLERIAEVQIKKQLEQNLGRAHSVTIGDVDPWWLGLQLQDVTIARPTTGARPTGGEASDGEASGGSGESEGETGGTEAEGAETDPANSGGEQTSGAESTGSKGGFSIDLPAVGVCFSPISSLLSFGASFGYFVGLEPGSVSGYATVTTSSRSLTVDLDDLDLEPSSDMIERMTGVPTFGRLEGYADLQFATGRPVITGGRISLSGRQLTIGPKEELQLEGIGMANYLKIPQTNLGSLDIGLRVEEKNDAPPKLVVDEFRSRGRDLETQIWGDITLAARLRRAKAQLKMRLKLPRQAFVDENQLGAVLRAEQFQSGKHGDWYGFVLWGQLGNVNFKGATTAAKGPNEGGSKESGPSTE